jgi:PEP-CTERM motif-containing protein
MNGKCAVLLSLVLLFFAVGAKADDIYTYSGDSFLQGSFTLSTPLGDNLSNYAVVQYGIVDDPAYESSDFIMDGTDFGPGGIGNSGDILVSTDANGNITGWYLAGAEYGGDSWPWFLAGNGGIPYTGDYERLQSCDSNSPSCDLVSYPANGVWTATATPEPSSLLLLSSGLVGLGFVKRRVFHS